MRPAIFISLLALLVACSRDEGPVPSPIVVYAPVAESARLAERIASFTAETGIPVSVKWGASRENTDALIAASGIPGDVLIVDNVADIWRAADEGALRPIETESLSSIPAQLRDPDRFWFAHRYYNITVIASKTLEHYKISAFSDLSDPRFSGELCLASSEMPFMRTLIAMLIADAGEKATQQLVRSWLRNLALPPFDSEEALAQAVAAGHCRSAIVSGRHVDDAVWNAIPTPAAYDIDAVGIGRHAGQPEAAQRFAAWLIDDAPKTLPAIYMPTHANAAGWHAENARLLTERLGYR